MLAADWHIYMSSWAILDTFYPITTSISTLSKDQHSTQYLQLNSLYTIYYLSFFTTSK